MKGLLLLACISVGIVNVYGQVPILDIIQTVPETNTVTNEMRAQMDSDVTLSCMVENKPSDVSVIWQKIIFYPNGTKGDPFRISTDTHPEDNTKYSIEKPTPLVWRLRIKAIQIVDEGYYNCYVQVTDAAGNNVQEGRTVSVTAAPKILDAESSSDSTVREGENIDLHCNASGRPFPTILWTKGGNAVLPGGGVTRLSSLLTISNAEPSFRGTYMCTAMNEMGIDRRSIYLDVKFAPRPRFDPVRQLQAIGYRKEIVCAIEGNPEPLPNQISWVNKMGERITDSSRFKIQYSLGAMNRVESELTIFNVQEEDFQQYSCRAFNNEGSSLATMELVKTDTPQPGKIGQIIAGGSATMVSIATMVVCIVVRLIH
ncbi:unnamed protein product [Owenia fusiformis]|uniref:Ig-like domain-containing protein n=1 Tax=Owenia fusiformis TaxID=6347 RepID=A0A8S4PVK7_OWEFU|nr:unnamed protein product [Owenia fusiformis]